MTNVLILGANGRIAQIAERRLLKETNCHLTLVLRDSGRLRTLKSDHCKITEGDVSNSKSLNKVMSGQDIVYANLAGNMTHLSQVITQSMKSHNIKKLIWITGSGLYHETPDPFGTWVEKVVGHKSKEDTRQAARIIEGSDLQYTIIRAAYMTDSPKIDYDLTQKGEIFRGTMVSRASIADLILKVIAKPDQYARTSLGISQPGSDMSSVVKDMGKI